MPKPLIITCVILVLLVLCCCAASGVGLFFINNYLAGEAKTINTEVLAPICATHGEIKGEDADYFSEAYTNAYGVSETAATVEKIFPADFNCADLIPDNLVAMFTRGRTFTVSTTNGKTTAIYMFPNLDAKTSNTIMFEKVANVWVIDSMESTSTGTVSVTSD